MPKRHRLGRVGIPIRVFLLRRGSMLGPDDHIEARYDTSPENHRTGE
jgi:hypothetical protein